jgi:hypothetical protein
MSVGLSGVTTADLLLRGCNHQAGTLRRRTGARRRLAIPRGQPGGRRDGLAISFMSRCLARLRLVAPRALAGRRTRIWHLASVDDELVPVARVDANREPHGRTGLVECGPEDFKDSDAAVLGMTLSILIIPDTAPDAKILPHPEEQSILIRTRQPLR